MGHQSLQEKLLDVVRAVLAASLPEWKLKLELQAGLGLLEYGVNNS